MTVEEIALQQEAFINTIIGEFTKDFEKVFAKAQSLMQVYVANGGDALTADVYWLQALNDSGYNDLVNKFINEDFDRIYKNIRDAFEAGGIPISLSNESLSQILGLKQLDADFFTSLASNSAQTVKTNLYKYTLSNMTAEQMVAQIALDLEGTALSRYSTTYAMTSITNFQQGVINVASKGVEDAEEYAGWVYVGANDSKTRDFCKNILDANKVLTQDEKNELEADPRREYNCRHTFHPISIDDAKDQGYA